MARARPAILLLVALTLLAPLALAQGAVQVSAIRILDGDGDALRIIPRDEFVAVEVDAENTGSTNFTGAMSMRIRLDSADGADKIDQTLSKPGPLGPGETDTFVYAWAPTNRVAGQYTVTAQMTTPSTSALVADFEVAETGVPAGSVAERVANYYWFFGLFLVALLLFFIVLGARRS